MKRIVIATICSVLTAVPASAQFMGYGPNLGAGPGNPYAMSQSYGGPDGDSMQTLYPVRRYIVRRKPVYVQPGPIIINNSRVTIDNKRVYVRNKNTIVRRVVRPRTVYIPEPVYTIEP